MGRSGITSLKDHLDDAHPDGWAFVFIFWGRPSNYLTFFATADNLKGII